MPDVVGEPVSWFVVDEATYSDGPPWPGGTDGAGKSLRRTIGSVGSEPSSWTETFPSPGLPPYLLIVADSGPHGAVVPSGEVWVRPNMDAVFGIVAGNWCHLAGVWIDGVPAGTPGQYTFTNVVNDHTIHAEFTAELATNQVPLRWLAASHPAWTNNFDTYAVADYDADGMATWQEWVAGTDATNPASVFRLLIAPTNGAGISVSISTVRAGLEYDGQDRYYSIEEASDLVEGTWSGIPEYTRICSVPVRP